MFLSMMDDGLGPCLHLLHRDVLIIARVAINIKLFITILKHTKKCPSGTSLILMMIGSSNLPKLSLVKMRRCVLRTRGANSDQYNRNFGT